jgi:hypothetical protein
MRTCCRRVQLIVLKLCSTRHVLVLQRELGRAGTAGAVCSFSAAAPVTSRCSCST